MKSRNFKPLHYFITKGKGDIEMITKLNLNASFCVKFEAKHAEMGENSRRL